MDVGKPIVYRNVNVNGAALQSGRVLKGIAVETVDYSEIEVAGYTEKRAGADGIHASDVYLGRRMVQMAGFIYATSQEELFDYLHVLRSVFSPTSAYQESPGDRGFLPLLYSQVTADHDSFPALPAPDNTPAGLVPLYMNVRPDAPVRFSITRDRQQQTNGRKSAATPWSVRLLAKDPRVYIRPAQFVPVDGAPQAALADAVATNRGDYETPFNIQLIVGAAVPPANASFHVTGLNGLDMTIKIEAKAKTIYRWMGDDRVLMTEDITNGPGTAPLILRMDLVTFLTKQRRPTVPASINPPSRPFTTPWHYQRVNLTLDPGSRCFWGEAFA